MLHITLHVKYSRLKSLILKAINSWKKHMGTVFIDMDTILIKVSPFDKVTPYRKTNPRKG